MWLPRLSIFSEDNKYYKQGGQFNIYTGDVRMPNCTAYAYLRMEEEMELDDRYSYLVNPNGGFGNAKTWYNTSPLPKGREIKEGGCLVFNGNAGHVCICEQKEDDYIIVSQSQYDSNKSRRDYKYWESRKVYLTNGIPSMSGVGEYIGCLYPPIRDIRVKRDSTKHQIEITESMVNVRISPNGNIFCKGLYAPKGIFNVSNEEIVDGYKWFELEKNHWVREGEWLQEYDIADEDYYKDLYWKEVEENKKLKNRLDEIRGLSEYE